MDASVRGYAGIPSHATDFHCHFTETLDAIDRTESCPCYHRWLELVKEYQERIDRYPLLVPDSSRKHTAASLTTSHSDAPQRYVDTLNRLLDDDFIVVKKLLFPSVWKIGVGCHLLSQEHVLYQLSSIRRGEPAPFIFELPDSVTPNTLGQNVQTSVAQPRETFFSSPEKCAREYALGFVRDLWRAKAFPLYGAEMAADVVLGFVQRYHRWLEITPESDEYRMQDLRRAFGPVLSKTTSAVAARALVTSSATQVVDLDVMASQLTHAPTAGSENGGMPRTYVVSSKTVPIRPSFAGLALLSTMRVQTVRRIFRVRDLEYRPPPNNFIWSCYSRAREIDNATAVLTHAIREYEVFIRGNAFHIENSPYLDPTVSIVFEYVSSYDDPQGPGLHEWHLRDPHRALEKTSVLVADASRPLGWPHVVINNLPFEVIQKVSRSVDFFFAECPLSNLVYRFLADDLKRQYQMSPGL